MNITHLSLSTFSTTGGIQQFNKSFIMALAAWCEMQKHELSVISSHDSEVDTRYIAADKYEYYKGNKVLFALKAVHACLNADVIFVAHINLSPVINVVRQLNPRARIILMAHGIEVWNDINPAGRKMLTYINRILAVSEFTRGMLMKHGEISGDIISVFPNTLDPFFNPVADESVVAALREKYQIPTGHSILFSLCRLSADEQYKGYDRTIEALPLMLKQWPGIHYLIGGAHDPAEFQRVRKLTEALGVENHVTLTGPVGADEITAHYALGDVFVMPSKGEGFGIVFLEALACGMPVVAGDQDGSSDALAHAHNAFQVNPDNHVALADAVTHALQLGKNPSPKVFYDYQRFSGLLQKELSMLCETEQSTQHV